jgi:hypothetical protein
MITAGIWWNVHPRYQPAKHDGNMRDKAKFMHNFGEVATTASVKYNYDVPHTCHVSFVARDYMRAYSFSFLFLVECLFYLVTTLHTSCSTHH